jgi:hypothetical protein
MDMDVGNFTVSKIAGLCGEAYLPVYDYRDPIAV